MSEFIVGPAGALLLVGTGLLHIFCIGLWLPFAALEIGWRWAIWIFFFPPLGIIFAIKYWSVARRPVLCALYRPWLPALESFFLERI